MCADDPCAPDPCNGHGTCNQFSGSCSCEATFSGTKCNQCASGFSGYPECRTEGYIPIKAGSFWMGSPEGCPAPEGYPGDCAAEYGRETDETLHFVTLTYDFEMKTTETTQGEWAAAFPGTNPSYFGPNGAGADCGSDCPVERVNWFEALAYANRLSTEAGLPE